MQYKKIIASLLIGAMLVQIFPMATSALSTGVVAPEQYPGKMDIRNVSGIGKNISNDFFAGAMTFSYPFSFPMGSRGMTPSLALSYSSNNSDAFSPYGYGFSLSIPRIQPSAKKGVSELYTQDEFAFGGQDLVPESTQHNQFVSKDMSDASRYIRTSSGGWMVGLPDGKSRIFGSTPLSRIADPNDPKHIYAWLLDEERDPFGHAIKYEYAIDGGQPYLSRISYGFDREGRNPMYQIRFDYIAKSASLSSYRTQFEVSTKKLLSKIELLAGGNPVRSYQFSYDSTDTPISHLISISERGATGETLPATSLSYGEGQYQHMITGVDNHRGGQASFEYAPSTGYRTGSGDLENGSLPFVVQTLAKETLTDMVTGLRSTETYSYGSGHYYYDSTDIWGREYVGFARVNIRDATTDKTVYFHQSQTASPDPLKYQDHIAKKGRAYRTDIRDIKTSGLLSRELVRYDMRTSANRWLVFPRYTVSSLFAPDGTHADTAVSYEVDDIGSITRETRNGWVTADLDNGTFTDILGDSVVIDRSYVSNPSSHLYGFLSSESVSGFSGELLATSRVEYDGSLTGVTFGLPTAKTRTDVVTGDTARDTTLYSPQGLPIEKKDPLNNKTTFVYDDRDIALTRETNPLGWNIDSTYDYTLGKPTAIKNQNDVTTKIRYDTWGRELSRSRVLDGSETLLMATSYDDNSIPNRVTQTSYFTPEGDSKILQGYQDGWGRQIMTTTTTEKLGQYSISQLRYDARGNPIYAGYPVFATSSSWDTSLVLSGATDGESYRTRYPGVSYQYDALGRIVSQRDARGITKKSYTPKSESITNALGNTSRANRDAYGNLTAFTESLDGRELTTAYSYDGLSRPVSLRDAMANIRNWEYDGFGRLKKATDTHKIDDTTYGERKYAYDILGRLTEYTNGKGEKVNYIYDALSRITRESYPLTGSVTWSRDYLYDEGVRSLSTLSSITDTSLKTVYSYDPLGRKTRETTTIGDKTYTTGYDYNIASNLTNITYPDGGKTAYQYARGYIEGVDYSDPAGNLTHLITDISYTPNSMMQSVQYGNGALKTTARDPDHNYRLARSTVTVSGSTLLDTEYRYDAVSNIDRIRENGIEPLRKSIDYTYDALSRLKRAEYAYSVAGYNRTNNSYTYAYDDIGNISNTSDIGSYGYSGLGYASPHAVTSAGGMSYSYDAAGQTVSRIGPGDISAFSYSPYGEMLSSVKNGEKTLYAYDASRRRVLKSSPGLTEHHVIDGYEVEYESGAVVQVMNYEGGMMSSGTTNTGSTESGTTNSGVTQTESTDLGSIHTGSGEGDAHTGEIVAIPTDSMSSGSTSSLTESTGSTNTGSIVVTETGSTNSGSMSSGDTQTGEANTGSIDTGSINSGEVVSNSGIIESDSYIIITGYEASSMSGATPVTLTTTLTHIMLGDERIATFQSQTDDSPKTPDDDKLVYHISDHLNSSSLDLSSTGLVLQAMDYLPFGKSNAYEVTTKRVKGKKGGYTNKYRFANKQEDSESDLQYFEKRYYDNRIGRFTTEDPVYWEVGKTKRPDQYFTDPQQWNSYSYVRNNPINLVDPTGESIAGDSNPVQDAVWVVGTAIRGYWEMGKFITTEGAILMGTAGAIASQNQALVDVASTTQQGSTTPSPNSPNLGNLPPDKPPQKPDKPKIDNRISTEKGKIKISNHALEQMIERNITREQITNTINKGEQFKYRDLQSGEMRTGFYDKIKNIFVGKGDAITTVIRPKGGQTYINNIKVR